jgi:hypothetical protein
LWNDLSTIASHRLTSIVQREYALWNLQRKRNGYEVRKLLIKMFAGPKAGV